MSAFPACEPRSPCGCGLALRLGLLTFALRLSHSDTTVEPSPRKWARTYVSVIAVEVVVLLALWWLQRHFGV